MSKYKLENGISYNVETPDFMIELLEKIRARGLRVRFHWGDMKTGKDWGDVSGTISTSTGPIKVPILINNQRSMGGGAILTSSIVKIRYANKRDGGIIWEHPKYHR